MCVKDDGIKIMTTEEYQMASCSTLTTLNFFQSVWYLSSKEVILSSDLHPQKFDEVDNLFQSFTMKNLVLYFENMGVDSAPKVDSSKNILLLSYALFHSLCT